LGCAMRRRARALCARARARQRNRAAARCQDVRIPCAAGPFLLSFAVPPTEAGAACGAARGPRELPLSGFFVLLSAGRARSGVGGVRFAASVTGQTKPPARRGHTTPLTRGRLANKLDSSHGGPRAATRIDHKDSRLPAESPFFLALGATQGPKAANAPRLRTTGRSPMSRPRSRGRPCRRRRRHPVVGGVTLP